MDKNIFSGLDDLGFKNTSNIDLYAKDEPEVNSISSVEEKNDKDYLYDKTITCPVCQEVFTVKALKTSSYRMKDKDSDFFIQYDIINPYFYDVWLCNHCGYAAMKSDFERIRNFQIDSIKENITPKWKGRKYTIPYDANIAIERYKLSLLNYYYSDAKASKKAMNCLKLAWMCRLTGDTISENAYLQEALKGFNDAYFNEDFPVYGMDKYTTMYLIGELNRRTNNLEDAMIWFSKVITTSGINKRLKELARDQKDLIKESKCNHASEENDLEKNNTEDTSDTKKKGFFSSLFGK